VSEFVDTAIQSIDQRLSELGAERLRLEAARAELVGPSTRAATPSPKPATSPLSAKLV
jgi:hypothetical protein